MQRTNIYLSQDQLRLLKHLAAAENKSVSDLVRQAVDEFLRERLKESSNWQAEMDALVKRVRSRVGQDISEEGIEGDVRAAKKEAREARNEGRH
ncbi:ribbon-helix-helix domain-containing protein [Kyrpidia tusciae]|uniref:CopG domain protein DNA-binding domain protein n=1 Tax=Kyrpidia tusciae (strain DSM 2912 / NBRC 15312 / T2) TaxID=562970 RepID=D5WVM2_KYRT2|nr:ribbon-helix-helix domain-containing protein [Kyrpidia tusciae]ADG07565.1 CopG domain protein DNA-binding domain protein [Kyrpidia tusciae DSM 2912]